jgi:osmotically inducible protein OsmC
MKGPMVERHATAVWNGDMQHGGGSISVESGRLDQERYSAKSRFEDERGTNPEELLAAAHAGCFAMQLSHLLALNGTPAEELHAKSTITMAKDGAGMSVQSSALVLTRKVPSIDHATFQEIATRAKNDCPISRALGGLPISLDALLVA